MFMYFGNAVLNGVKPSVNMRYLCLHMLYLRFQMFNSFIQKFYLFLDSIEAFIYNNRQCLYPPSTSPRTTSFICDKSFLIKAKTLLYHK